jgi:uncharacterized membrane protein
MAWNDRKIVSGLFNSEQQVENVVNALENRGYSHDDVSIMMSDKTRDRYPQLARSSKMPEGAATGGVTGGLIGALIGGLTMAGSVLIPGASLLVAGPIVGAITGGAVGATSGGLIGALVGAGIPEHEAKEYDEKLQKNEGSILLMAHVDDEDTDAVKDIFRSIGAHSVDVQNDNSDDHHDVNRGLGDRRTAPADFQTTLR